jgi:acetyl esterase/lipase
METHVYADRDGTPLALDLYKPDGVEHPPVALYLHGGGWAVGTRADRIAERVAPVVAQGVAIASASYRLTDVARWPAQLEDVTAALAFLRDNAGDLGVRGDRLGAWGASAGGHLALMAALAGEVPVAAVVAYFPTTDFVALAGFRPGIDGPLPAFLQGRTFSGPRFEERLLGVAPVDAPDLARQAAPIGHVANAGSTRFLLVHGDTDGLVPHAQSELLHRALREAGADSTLLTIAGANHEDPAFDRPAILGGVAAFLR